MSRPLPTDGMLTNNPGVGRTACQRRDSLRRAIVDRALAVQSGSNTICAVEYLKAHGVNPEVIERVLMEPARRRQVPH